MTRPVEIHRLHHYAARCRDAEATRRFYEDLLGLPLAHVIRAEDVPSTGEHCPYVHLFFRLGDGSCIAFFDLGDGQAAAPSPNTPSWVQHIAFTVESERALAQMKDHLVAQGVEVIGPVDHGFVRSIYFFDPNGVRLELTTQVVSSEEVAGYERDAHRQLAAWVAEKAARPCR